MNAVTELARAIAGKVEEVRASEHNATVTRRDAEGTYWVSIPGGAEETPISTALVDASEGETVRVAIANGKSVMTGNVTSPSASGKKVSDIGSLANRAMTTAYQEKARIDQLETSMLTAESALITSMQADTAKVHDLTAGQLAASTAYISALTAADLTAAKLVADDAYIGSLTAESVTAESIAASAAYIASLLADEVTAQDIAADHAAIQDLDVESLTADFARIDLANVNAADIAVAKVREVFARSGWFDEVTITGDASITGQLKSVLIDGDTARFRNIYADALKLLGPDGLYYALNLAGLDATQVADLIAEYQGEELEEGLHGSHIIAESVTATQIDVSSLVAAMLLAEVVQVGASGGIHTEMNGVRFSFLAGGYHLPADPSQLDPLEPLAGEVAYIAIDPDTQDSMFYINRAVVVTDLRFGKGNWKWYSRDNDNMSLKWMGGDV